MSIQSVERALDILELFSPSRRRLGISEISREMGLPKTTVHGLVTTLCKRGFLHRDPDTRKYELGLKLYELGAVLASCLEVNQRSAPFVQRLAREVRLMARVALWDGDTALVTLSVHPRSRALQFPQIGPRIPGYCSAIGKAVLAFLPPEELKAYLRRNRLVRYTPRTITEEEQLLQELDNTRMRGYALDRGEIVSGLACIGAPIRRSDGQPIASISVSGDPRRILGETLETLAERLLHTAEEVSREMGYIPGSLGSRAADHSQP
jgi:DNA-binding IclR family transcriptional regulator